jgi:Na+/proline symporter
MEGAYVWVMVHYLPPSLRGLMLAGFAAAYMSTIGTHLNLGASYMINDLYKRFFAPDKSARHYVAASRIATILVALLSASATGYMLTHGASIATAWKFLLALGAGAGLVFILRWYWWRINAWSEIAAMTAAATISLTLESRFGMPAVRALHHIDPALALVPLNQDDPHAFAWLMLTTTLLTTAIWLAVTLATQPETEATLQAFYDRVRPAALGWRRFAQSAFARENEACHSERSEESPHFVRATTTTAPVPDPAHDPTLRYNFFHWVLGFTLVYAMLFGVGDLLFGRVAPGCGLLALSGSCLAVLFYSLNRRGWSVWR